jgi:hypothetical protein
MKNKLLLLFACIAIPFCAFSQVTYLADTAFHTDIGFGGSEASCVFSGGHNTGYQVNRALGDWLADVFTVPADTAWKFDTVILYGYEVNGGTATTFADANLEIYNAPPGLGGSVIWGDTFTNVLVATGWTGIYRVDTIASAGGLLQTARAIMYLKLHLNPAPLLSSGTYWLAWSFAGTFPIISSPVKVLPGRINPPGQQARGEYSGVWNYVTDNGNDVGFSKIIKASAAVAGITEINKAQAAVLSQNIPNPFTGATSISFYLPEEGYTRLCVYNVVGQLVATLINGDMNAGRHDVTFSAGDLPAGAYFYKLSTGTVNESRQMLLIR